MKHTTMRLGSAGRRSSLALALALAVPSCVGGIDVTNVSPISNDDTFALLGYLWGGARNAIGSKREPDVGSFNLPLSYQLPCARGGRGTYQGTVSGTKAANGTGSGTLALTATLTACQFDDRAAILTISAPNVTVTGTIAIANDTWGAISIRMVASTASVNGVACPGGVDVMLTGASPSAPPISTGTSCGRTGAVALP